MATTCHSASARRTPQIGDGLTVRTNHPSVDQLIASQLGARTRFPSLEFGVRPVGGDVPCIVNFTLDGSPMPRMADDRAAFDRVFGTLAGAAGLRPERQAPPGRVRASGHAGFARWAGNWAATTGSCSTATCSRCARWKRALAGPVGAPDRRDRFHAG